MNALIRTMTTMSWFSRATKQAALGRGLMACALIAPLLMAGCSPIKEEFRVSKGQKEVPLTLSSHGNEFKFFGMTQGIVLVLSAPESLVFADKTSTYRLDLAVGQRRHYSFELFHSDGKAAQKIEVQAEGYERPSAAEQPFEKRVYSKAPNNKPYTPTWLSTQYRYILGHSQESMALNIGNFREDPKSEFFVQGRVSAPVLLLRAPAGEQFVFSKNLLGLGKGDQVPLDAVRAQDYSIRMAPGSVVKLQLWLSNENNRLRTHNVEVQYSSTR